MKPSLTVPILKGKLSLGTWQQIVFMDFDNRGSCCSGFAGVINFKKSFIFLNLRVASYTYKSMI